MNESGCTGMTRRVSGYPPLRTAFSKQQAIAEQERDRAQQERDRAQQQQLLAEQERDRAQQQQAIAQQERDRAERLAAKLRALGVEPDAVD
jgi:F0F1-type ATP synthase membrane subunit b/b'